MRRVTIAALVTLSVSCVLSASADPATTAPATLAVAKASTETVSSPWGEKLFEWTQLPSLPDINGVAGAFAGVSGDALIVAGGANFPNGKPWENGKKVWHDSVYVLEDNSASWVAGAQLTRPLAYGVSATTPDGVLCAGGEDGTNCHAGVFRLKKSGSLLVREELPGLPSPTAYAAGVLAGDKMYVLGGLDAPSATSALCRCRVLDLKDLAAGWQELEPWPGPGRILPVAAALGNSVYVCSGASLAAAPDGKPVRTYLKDAYRYTPGKGWKRIADLPSPAVAAPSPAMPAGGESFAILGGDDGALAGQPAAPDHPGFPRTIVRYHAVTNTWTRIGETRHPQVTVPLVEWNGRFVLASGEIRPGVRTPEMWAVRMVAQKVSFGAVNLTCLALYMLGMLGIGFWCARSNRTTNDYFRGGQRIPWWAAGLSIFATMLSSITFMAIPAKAFAENWVFIVANLTILLLAPFIVFCVLPVFRRIDATSAYQYLEKRFNLVARLFGATSFLLLQLGRMAIVLYLPALALATVTDFNVFTCIVIMGILSVIYCTMGGVTAVIWTDVTQTIILLGGALLSLVLILLQTEGGVGEFMRVASANDKFHIANWTWDATVASLWVILVGNMIANLVPYMTDQGVVQRYMTTRDEKRAAKSIWLNAIVAMPASVLFFLVGTALYVHYVQHPERLAPGFQNDAVFPLFIAWELPVGVAGIVVAGIFAAAQSTVSTSMNSMSTVLVTDFAHRLRRHKLSDRAELVLARWLTVILGVLGTCGALLLASANVKSLWDVFLQLLGLAGSSLAGLFLLGIFTKRANGVGSMTGAVVSVVVLYCVQKLTPLHFFLYAVVGTGTCVIVGYATSMLFDPPPETSTEGLTIYSLPPAGTAVQADT